MEKLSTETVFTSICTLIQIRVQIKRRERKQNKSENIPIRKHNYYFSIHSEIQSGWKNDEKNKMISKRLTRAVDKSRVQILGIFPLFNVLNCFLFMNIPRRHLK